MVFSLIYLCSLGSYAQVHSNGPEKQQSLTYGNFIQKLTTQNLGYIAEKYNLAIADAEMEAAKILPDPELSFTAFDNQERRMNLGYGFEAELEWDLELGGKRKARKKLAGHERELAELELQQYFYQLRKEATLIFLEALQKKMHLEIQQKAYETMLDIARQDSVRFEEGKIKKSAASQSRLEAESLLGDLQEAHNDWDFSLLELKNMVSTAKHDTVFVPVGELKSMDRIFNLEELIQSGIDNCLELKIAHQEGQLADGKIAMAKADRIIDLGLSLGVENNSFSRNIIAPTPAHTAVFAGVSVPLKFSNSKESGLKTASYEKEQTRLSYQALKLEVEKDITQAFQKYVATQEQLKSVEANLKEAAHIYEDIRNDYFENKGRLLEVLNAERTYNRIHTNYINTLFTYAAALVELESSAGIWDIEL